MSQVVIYPLTALAEDGGAKIAVLFPAPRSRFTVEQIAMKDVPIGTPYLIIDSSELPEDPAYRDAWDADFSQPHGHGLGYDEFAKRYIPAMPLDPAGPAINPEVQ